MEYELVAPDAREQLRRWDAGESIWSIEMGGLGPGYEQAIQVLAVEILRDWIDKPLPEKMPSDWADDTVKRIDYRLPDGKFACGGFSGAQVGAAKLLAHNWLLYGPKFVHERIDLKDRRIQVSNTWPRAPRGDVNGKS